MDFGAVYFYGSRFGKQKIGNLNSSHAPGEALKVVEIAFFTDSGAGDCRPGVWVILSNFYRSGFYSENMTLLVNILKCSRVHKSKTL